jgi:hypothetical protein
MRQLLLQLSTAGSLVMSVLADSETRLLPTFFENSMQYGVLAAVAMKSSIFWDIAPCSPLKVSRHFEGTSHLHLIGRRINSRPEDQFHECEIRGFLQNALVLYKIRS